MDKEFYDLCYEAWWAGRNPDSLSYDRWADLKASGYYPDEISLNMMLPQLTTIQPSNIAIKGPDSP